MDAEECSFHAAIAALLPQLRAFARFLGRDPALADDLVQDTVLRALERRTAWQPGTDLRAWCFRILRNIFLDRLRRRGAESRALAHIAQAPAVASVQHDRDALHDLDAALALLPPLQREALVLVAALGLEVAEAAAVTGVPEGTVKARVSRARATLARSRPTPRGPARC